MVQQTIEPTSALGHEQRLSMSYEEYLAWQDEGKHGEWVDGEGIVFVAPTIVHQQLLFLLAQVISLFAEARDLGVALPAPCEMRVFPDGPAREPDILYVKREHLARLQGQRLSGPADLIIEIISPESEQRDRLVKYDEYEAAGIPEYWWVDPRPGRLRFKAHYLDGQGRYHSRVIPGFWVDPAWFWQVPLPKVWQALHAIDPATFPALSTPTH